jgi:glycosyltransferase involved in cell wall biosynthesis
MTNSALKPRLPAITVIVCCFNAEPTIGETLQSLLEQTWLPAAIRVIDDGSRDGSVDLVSRFAAENDLIRLIRNAANRGTAYCRQLGLTEAATEAVMFLDADDIADPALLEKQGRALAQDPSILGVGSHAHYFSGSGADSNIGRQRVGALDQASALLMYRQSKLMFMSPATLFRRQDALAAGGYRQSLLSNAKGIRYEDFAEDLDLWCRMADLGAEGRYFLTIPEVLFRYRKPPGSLSTKNLKLMQLKMRWIKDCMIRRRNGRAERSLAEFIASRSLRERLNDWRSDKAAAFYKAAGFSYASRHYLRLGLYLLLTAAVSPKLIRQKLKTQSVFR